MGDKGFRSVRVHSFEHPQDFENGVASGIDSIPGERQGPFTDHVSPWPTASEAGGMRWDAVMLNERRLVIHRLKGSESGQHPLQLDEVEALKDLREAHPGSQYLFINERGQYLSRAAIAKIVRRCGEAAELPLPVHPHMLRHACGYYLANQGLDTRLIQDWLGHRNIEHTVRYTKLNPKRFEEIRWG